MVTTWQRSIVLKLPKVHKIAIFGAFKWNKLPLHRSIYHTVKFYKSLCQTYKNKGRGSAIHTFQTSLPPSSKRGCYHLSFFSDFRIWYFWEFKRNLTNLCKFPKWWVIHRSLKIYFCFDLRDIWLKKVHSPWCTNVAVSDRGKQLETAFILFISCYHASVEQRQKLSNTSSHHDRDLRWFPEVPAVIRLAYHGHEGIPEETHPASCISTFLSFLDQ